MFFRQTYAKVANSLEWLKMIHSLIIEGQRDAISIQKELIKMSKATNELRDTVAAVRGTVNSAVALITGIAARIEAVAGQGEDEVRALAADLRAENVRLSDAVAMNDDDASTNPHPVGSEQNPEPSNRPEGETNSTDQPVGTDPNAK